MSDVERLALKQGEPFFLLRAMGRLMANSILEYSLADIARILGGKVHGSGNRRYIQAPAPGHSANDDSLTIKIGKEHPGNFLVKSFCGDDELKLKDYVREKLSLPAFSKANGKHRPAKKLRATVPPIQDPKPISESIDGMTPDERLEAAMSAKPGSGAAKGRTIAEVYDYKDIDGTSRYQIVRYEPKGFPAGQPDGNDDWIWNLAGIEQLPYHLDEIAAQPDAKIFICEGEKDTDRSAQNFRLRDNRKRRGQVERPGQTFQGA